MREDIRDVIDINSFKEAIQEELGSPTAIHDYVVMMFTIGNDFLPHTPSLEDMNEAIKTLMRIYMETGMPLTTIPTEENPSDIDWKGLTAFLTNLSKDEHRLLKHAATRDVKYPSRMLVVASTRTEKIEDGGVMMVGKKITYDTKFYYNIFRGAWYQNELSPKGQNFAAFQKIIPGNTKVVTMDKVIDMCQQYLIGMAWVYNYYTRGTIVINSDFVYKYHHTPLLSDLTLVISQLESVEGYLAHGNQVVLNPIHQLLSVLPLKSKDLLPREVKHLMTKDSPIADLYPDKVIVEMDGKNREWQGTVLIPFVDPSRVITAVNNTTVFSTERAKLYAQGNNIVIIRDPDMAALDNQKQKFRQFMQNEKDKRYGRQGNNQNRGRGRQGYRNNRNNQNKGRGGYRNNKTRDKGYSPKGRGGNQGNKGYQGNKTAGGYRGKGYQGKGYQGKSHRRQYNKGRGNNQYNKNYNNQNKGVDNRPSQYGSPQDQKEKRAVVWKKKTTIL